MQRTIVLTILLLPGLAQGQPTWAFSSPAQVEGTSEASLSWALVFFSGANDPNQSATIELKERVDKLEAEAGRIPGSHNTLVLFEKGAKAKALLRGTLGSKGIAATETWRNQDDLNELVQG